MTLLPCPECTFTGPSVDDLDAHLWEQHRPEGIERSGHPCPECELPLTKRNFPNHYPCLFDHDLPGFLGTATGIVCPVCGDTFDSRDALESHLDSHSEFERLELLSDTQSCRKCGDPISANNLRSHFACLLDESRSKPPGDGNQTCPLESCDISSETKGGMLAHVWEAHFGEDSLQGECPGCHSSTSLGQLQAHLGCLDEISLRRASDLLPEGKACVLCGLSVYDRNVLHRHYYQKHIDTKTECPGCSTEFEEDEGADVLDHVWCLATVEDQVPLDELEEQWYCPCCGTVAETEETLVDHLYQEHLSDLRGRIECEICGETVESMAAHDSCLLDKATFSEGARSRISEEVAHEPVESHSQSEYFGELKEFVATEKETAREVVWDQYDEQSLETVLRKRSAIPELIPTGEQFHPDFDNQVVYQIPDEAERNNPRNIVDKYGIYPGTEVILGGPSGHHLPRAALVTFVDSPSIGFALRQEDGPVNKQLIRELSNDDTSYHCVELINPTPYDREEEAIDRVESRRGLRDLVLGDSSFSERPVSLSDATVGELNEFQKHAVERALGTEQFICIHGPPGTGKTRTLTRLIRLAIARGERVLATSHSNQAIDNLLAGTSAPKSPDKDSLHYVASPAGSDRSLPYELQRKLEEDPDDEDLQALADSLLERPDEIAVARVGDNSSSKVVQGEYVDRDVHKADLVTGTMSALAELDPKNSFDMVVVDEAAQATQPSSFIPLLRGKRVVLAGDHLQLPPYAADEQAKEEDMHISLFEHLLTTYGTETSVMLQRQYRMNEEIAAFPSEYVYDGKLETGAQNQSWTIDDLAPIMAVDVAGDERTDEVTKSKKNPTEAQIVADHVKLLQMQDVPLRDIGVITPYTAQIGTIRSAINNEIGGISGLKVDTIDSFQGSEREAIIISFVRSNPGNHTGFLALPEEGKRRLNVALTRAKKRVVLVGDWNTLGTCASYEDSNSASELYSSLYSMLNEKGRVKETNRRSIAD